MEVSSFNPARKENIVSPPSVNSRLNYIQARLRGLTPDRVIEQALEERMERVENQVHSLATALLERQEQVECTISELTTEVESLKILEPAEKQIERLQNTFSELKQKQASLTSDSLKSQQSLDRKTQRRNQLATEIRHLNQLARQPQSNEVNTFLDQLGQRLPLCIHRQLNKS